MAVTKNRRRAAGWIGLGLMLFAAIDSAAAQRARHPSRSAAVPASAEKQFPFNVGWVLQSQAGRPVMGDAPSFTLDDKLRATGFSGCNTFSMALYPVRGQKLAAGAIAVTRKTCDPAAMASERSFLIGLHSMPSWEVTSAGELSIKGAAGPMLFRRGI